jgi:hypothetical protein
MSKWVGFHLDADADADADAPDEAESLANRANAMPMQSIEKPGCI